MPKIFLNEDEAQAVAAAWGQKHGIAPDRGQKFTARWFCLTAKPPPRTHASLEIRLEAYFDTTRKTGRAGT